MSTKKRRNFTPDEKVAILKKNLLENVAVSDLCDQYSLHPTVFYRWQKEFFENGAWAFEKKKDSRVARLEKKIARLESYILFGLLRLFVSAGKYSLHKIAGKPPIPIELFPQ